MIRQRACEHNRSNTEVKGEVSGICSNQREREHPDRESSRREQAARQRAARGREERMEEALRQLPWVQAAKERQKKHAGKAKAAKVKEARVSTTDPSARTMKMADGGFRPAYNIQYATDTRSQVIVGVDVTNRGTDQGQALGMERQVEKSTGKQPESYLVDGAFIDLQDIKVIEQKGIEVCARMGVWICENTLSRFRSRQFYSGSAS